MATFNHEKALVGAFSGIVQLHWLIVNSITYCLVCKHFHKLHHTYKQPTAFSVTAIHPVEFLNIQAVYISPMFTVPMYAREYTTKIFWYRNIFEKRWEIFLKNVYCDKIFLAICLMIKYNILKIFYILATYCFMLLYIYYHGIIDHSGINFKVRVTSQKLAAPLSRSFHYARRRPLLGPTWHRWFLHW